MQIVPLNDEQKHALANLDYEALENVRVLWNYWAQPIGVEAYVIYLEDREFCSQQEVTDRLAQKLAQEEIFAYEGDYCDSYFTLVQTYMVKRLISALKQWRESQRIMTWKGK